MNYIESNEIQVQVSNSAVARVYELVELENNNNLKLRVYVIGGGCSGFQYGFSFDEVTNEGDLIIDKFFNPQTNESFDTNQNNNEYKKISFVIDPISLNYLIGGKIDYIDNLMGARFMVTNPNASSTCSCGSSFAID